MGTLVDFAEKLRNQIDIVAVVEEYVPLRRAGTNLKGLCPFHREKTPSFTVSASKQIYHCFGCGEGGDVIRFVQKAERIDWVEAVRLLSDKFHIPMPEFRPSSGGRGSGETDPREKLLSANRKAADFFAAQLRKEMSDADGELAGYLKRRAIDVAIASRFGLGAAPDGWTKLVDALAKSGIKNDLAVQAGVALQNADKNRVYDRFRKRLVFPISDATGRPIAFGARTYASDAPKDEPKYVNSPETQLYKKSQTIYALHLAREVISRTGRALLMEGYMDVLRAHQYGFENAVASCGTALTDDQARILKKYCSEVVFLYDGDEAGQKAMVRGCMILLDHEFTVRIVGLPDDHDPDSFLTANGADAFGALVDGAKDFFDFFLQAYGATTSRNSVEGKVRITELMLPFLRKIANPIAQHEYCRKLAGFLVVEEQLIRRQLSRTSSSDLEKMRRALAASDALESVCERMLLKLAVESPDARRKLSVLVDPEWFQDTTLRKWFELCKSPDLDDSLCWDYLLARCDQEEEARFLRALALDDREPLDDSDKAIQHGVARIHLQHQHQQLARIAEKIAEFYSEMPPERECIPIIQELDAGAQSAKVLGNQIFIGKTDRKN